MDPKRIQTLIRETEKAVQPIRDKSVRIKAFEVVLRYLLESEPPTTSGIPFFTQSKVRKKVSKKSKTVSLSDRLLLLKDEGFFVKPRSLSEVKEELKRHAWHYPLTSMSGPIAKLVSQRSLRRVRERDGNKNIWKYTNP